LASVVSAQLGGETIVVYGDSDSEALLEPVDKLHARPRAALRTLAFVRDEGVAWVLGQNKALQAFKDEKRKHGIYLLKDGVYELQER
jgi:hypothetical protein